HRLLPSFPTRRSSDLLRFASVFAGLWSTLMLVGAASGGDSALRPLEHFGTAVAATGAGAPTKPDYVAAKSVADVDARIAEAGARDRKSTRLNSSHVKI